VCIPSATSLPIIFVNACMRGSAMGSASIDVREEILVAAARKHERCNITSARIGSGRIEWRIGAVNRSG
jgi:hypothetical protein